MAEARDHERPANETAKPKQTKLDKEVKDTFPASDTPSSVQPGSGITGTEPARRH